MSQFATCLLEFLLFLGIPYLRQLQRFIDAAITQLEILKGEALAQLALTQAASERVNQAIGIAQLVANDVQNALNGLPIGAFQECGPVSTLIGTLRDPFEGVLNFFDEAVNEANRIRAFTDVQSRASDAIDEQIAYLRDLNSQIDETIIELLRRQAESL